jgi:hypothetical protein
MKIQQDIALAAACVEPKLKKALRELAKQVPDRGKSKTSFATFNFFLTSCDAIFSYAFSIPNVRGGWQKCGLAPFNPKLMMISFAFFKDLEKVAPDAADQVLAAIPRLAAVARDAGFVTDEEMESELGALFSLSPAFAATYMESNRVRAPVNHRRCIWLSNPSFLSSERRQRQQLLLQRPVQVMRAPAPVAAEHAVAAAASESSWRFPCKWSSADGTIIECRSKDKKKAQHIVSKAHLKFLADVDAQRLLDAAAHVIAEADIEEGFGLINDPLDIIDLALPIYDDDNDSHDDDGSDSSEDDLSSVFHVTPSRDLTDSPIGGGGAAPNTGNTALLAPGFSTRSRSHSRTPTRVHFADDESSAKRQRLQ